MINNKTVCDLYNEGMSLRGIGDIFGVSYKPILTILKKHNINRRQSKYSLDDNYFKNVDTSNKAYILGLLYADGNLTKNTVKITLHEKDKHILDSINSTISSNRVLYKYKQYYTLTIVNKIMSNDLRSYGLIENKTFKVSYPYIDHKFTFDFIRGVFDGDGYFHVNKKRRRTGVLGIVGYKPFLQQIQGKLLLADIESKIYSNSSRHKDIAELRIGKVKDIERMFDLMYPAELCFNRKYGNIFEFISR